MTRDAEVFASGEVRHREYKTIYPVGWYCVSMNRERFAWHAQKIAFLNYPGFTPNPIIRPCGT